MDINLVIIGFGNMGEYHYNRLQEFNKQGQHLLNVVGIYDIDNERIDVAHRLGLYAYEKFEDILKDENVHAVLISTPNDKHVYYTIEAAKAKKHIICEKPIALNLNEAKKMYKVASDNNVLLAVHQNRRWDDDFLTVKKMYDEKLYGEVNTIECNICASNGIPGGWRKLVKHGGGMMLDWGVHLIDRLMLLSDAKVEYIYCEYSHLFGFEVDDGFRLSMKLSNGLNLRCNVDTNCFKKVPRWQVYAYDGTAQILDWKLNGSAVVVKERVDKDLKPMQAGNGLTKTMADRSQSSVVELPLEIVHAEPFAFYKNFCKAVSKEEELAVKKEEVFRVIKLMNLAEKSAKNHKTIKANL